MYATAAELRAQIGNPGPSTISDTMLTLMLEAAGEAINNLCNRPDGFLAGETGTARVYAASGGPVLWIDECIEVTLVEVRASDNTYVAWTSNDWIAFRGDPKSPDFNRTPHQGLLVTSLGNYRSFPKGRGVPTVRITARWGYAATVPAVIKQACIEQAARWTMREKAGWADTLANGEFGQKQYVKSLDPDIEMQLVRGRFVRVALG
jgi:hypothetical protein